LHAHASKKFLQRYLKRVMIDAADARMNVFDLQRLKSPVQIKKSRFF